MRSGGSMTQPSRHARQVRRRRLPRLHHGPRRGDARHHPGFPARLDEAKLITPQRSTGGHRRYSRYQLRLAARARELVDQGTPLEAACRIIILEDQLAEALRLNEQLRTRDTCIQSPDGSLNS